MNVHRHTGGLEISGRGGARRCPVHRHTGGLEISLKADS